MVMAEIAKKHKEKLKPVKRSIEEWQQYFQENNDRYHDFMRFVFKTSLTSDDKAILDELSKPTIEFNILEAYISRLRGEFAKQEPNLSVRAADGVSEAQLTAEFLKQIDVIEGHLRAIFFDAENDSLEYNIYTDLLGGGYSVMEVYTDYINEMSFDQNIFVARVFDPTLCGFDPLARESHKGDGSYCFQIAPRTRKEFEEEFGEEISKGIKCSRDIGGFSWSYKNEREDVILVADFYEKERVRTKILKLSNGRVVSQKDYDKLLEMWNERGYIEQPPIPIGKPRFTMLETIVRYRICENQVLDVVKTNYKHLPLVFVDGNSVQLREENNGPTSQMTRPFVYHAKGIQKLKNFSGQTLANELENMIMHKFKVAIESIPEDYQDAYDNVQQASVLMYNAFKEDNPTQALPPPQEIHRIPTPPEVTNTFKLSDEITQAILGSYDAQLGINGNQLSGVAMRQGAMQSNAAAMPYIMGFIKGLNRVAQIIIDLIPKYYVTPRSLPILQPDGKRSYEVINKSGNIFMNYEPNSLQVRVSAGVNFAVQKQVALEQIIQMMQASPLFNRFINEDGLELLLANLDIKGIEELKQMAGQFMDRLKQEQQQAKQAQAQQTQQNPLEVKKEIEYAKIAQKQQEAMAESATATAKVAIDKQKADTEFMKVLATIQNDEQRQLLQKEKVDAENARSAVDMAISVARHQHEEQPKGIQGVEETFIGEHPVEFVEEEIIE